MSQPDKVYTTQATGKAYKLAQLAGVLLLCAGVVACTQREIQATTWLMLAGGLLYGAGRLLAWWNHG